MWCVFSGVGEWTHYSRSIIKRVSRATILLTFPNFIPIGSFLVLFSFALRARDCTWKTKLGTQQVRPWLCRHLKARILHCISMRISNRLLFDTAIRNLEYSCDTNELICTVVQYHEITVYIFLNVRWPQKWIISIQNHRWVHNNNHLLHLH